MPKAKKTYFLRQFTATALVSVTLLFGAQARAYTMDGSDAVKALQAIQIENRTRLHEINQQMLSNPSATNLGSLSQHFREHRLRQDFLDRLTFQVESRFTSGSLDTFLKEALSQMAIQEAQSLNTKDPSLWRFMSYTSELLEKDTRRQSPIAKIEGYMKKSGILNPVKPDQYLAGADYSNGVEFYQAKKISPEKLGHLVDQELRSIEVRMTAPSPKETSPLPAPQIKGVSRVVGQVSTQNPSMNDQINKNAEIKETTAE